MADRTLPTDKDIEVDGRPIHWHNMTFTGMDYDERQLSSDLENILKLPPASGRVQDVTPRGTDVQLEPKQVDRNPCRHAAESSATEGGAFNVAVSSTYSATDYTGSYLPQTTAAPHLAHPESHDMPWNQPRNPGPWRHDISLSSVDLEMDREPSIVPFNQIESAPSTTEYSKVGFEGQNNSESGIHGDIPATRLDGHLKYPYEDKLMRYECEADDVSNQQHEMWQQTVQVQQPTLTPLTTAIPAEDDHTMTTEEITYTFELDEFGEGPLHTLSAVTDKTTLAKSIDVLQECGVVSDCLNLQNRLKQTPLFLSVLQGNICLIAWLLQNGADPNIQGTLYIDRDEYIWRSPLHLAAMKGDNWLVILRMLITKSANTNINLVSYGDKLSALHLALKHHTVESSCRQTILELIDRGADISLREQSSSKTPFIMALESRDFSLIQEFLGTFTAEQRRFILQEQTRSGDTCLHIAAGLSRVNSLDKEKLLRFLVTNGANGNITNNVKEWPRDFARKEWDNIRKT